ncbi:MAG: hypothetical protein Q8907_06590 [Bacteroidota bacterium]|nr:hypothetical protein [Bacteroidota bacterium]MDP4225593.1 hypothetical protein [Bacteroidota bacterium]MDP4273929.1 hypothetical protein [Bacteroidota bacterium]
MLSITKPGIFLFLLFFLAMTGCSDEMSSILADCDNCENQQPYEAALNVKLTVNEENPRVPISIYQGKYEYNNVILNDTLSQENVHYDLPVNKNYSVVARYKMGNKTVYAIDGDQVKAKNSSTYCNTNCWIVTEGNVDVRLKKQ